MNADDLKCYRTNYSKDWTQSDGLSFPVESSVNAIHALCDEVEALKAELEVYARFAEQFGDLSCCYDAEDVVSLMTNSLQQERESTAALKTEIKLAEGERDHFKTLYENAELQHQDWKRLTTTNKERGG